MKSFKKKSLLLIIILITFFSFFTNVTALTASINNLFPSSSLTYYTGNVARYFKYLGVYTTGGKTTFCLEPGISFSGGSNFVEKTYDEYKNLRGNKAFKLDDTKKDLLSRVSTVFKNFTDKSDETKLAVQALYWEIITGERTKFTYCTSGNCTPNAENSKGKGLYAVLNANSNGNNKIQKIIKEYDNLVNTVYTVYTKNPGQTFKLDNLARFDFKTRLEYNDAQKVWTKTIYDVNNEFLYWDVVNDYPNGITVTKNNNSITITSNREIADNDSISIKIKTKTTTPNPQSNITVYINNSNKSSQALFDVGETVITKLTYISTEEKIYGIKIYKKDADTGKFISGARFELCKTNDCSDYDKPTSLAVNTDLLGLVQWPAEFKVDNVGTYYYREIEAPKGYEPDYEINKIEITEKNRIDSIDIFSAASAKIVVTNRKITQAIKPSEPSKTTYYQLKIKKIDSVSKAALSGVQFRICSDSNCKNIISTKTTDKNGEIIYNQLTRTGKYYIKEVEALDGYIKNDEIIEIDVTEENEKGTSKYAEKIIENDKKTYEFNLTKNTMDENGNVTKLEDDCYTGDRNKKSASFTIRDSRGNLLKFKEDEIEKGKYIISQDGEIEIKTCDGAFSVKNLTECEYTIEETKAPEGVTLPSNRTKKVNVCGSDKNISFTNGFTGLEFQKKDEDGNFISGGKFSLERKVNGRWLDVKVEKKQEGVYAYTSDGEKYEIFTKDGIAYISGLPSGEYRMIEDQAPEGYELIEVADSPKITISDEQKNDYYILTLINRKVNKYGSDASAELVITITTGRKVLNYVLIVSSLAALLVIAIIIRKKIKK